MLLLLDEGASYTQVQQIAGCTAPFVSKWKHRFLEKEFVGFLEQLVASNKRNREIHVILEVAESKKADQAGNPTRTATLR